MCQRDERSAPDDAPADPFGHPVRRHLAEYLLGKELGEAGMIVVVNEIARFKAGSGGETLDDVTLQTVREELEAYHVPVLEEGGIVERDLDEDRLSLASEREWVRRRLEEAKADSDRESYK